MKRESIALALAAGLTLSGTAAAANIEFFDLTNSTAILMGGTGLPSTTIDISTNIPFAQLNDYFVSLDLSLSDDEPADAKREYAVVAGVRRWDISINPNDTTARWYTWGGNVTDYLTSGAGSTVFFNQSLAPRPMNRDFFYYNAKLVFTPVPEASQWLLLGAGLVGVAGFARRRATPSFGV